MVTEGQKSIAWKWRMPPESYFRRRIRSIASWWRSAT